MSIQGNPFIIHDSSLVLSLDAANIKSFRGEPTTNVAPNPLDLFAWCINGANSATLSRDTSSLASPAGGIPMRMTTTGSDPYTNTYNAAFNLNAATQGQVWTMSVWAKANRILTCELFLFEANSSGVYINLSTVSISVTTEWQRFTLSRTNTEATVAYVQVRLDGPNTYSAGDIVWWDGLQVEQKAYATTFVSGSRGTTVETGGGLYDLTNGNNNGTLTNGPTFNNENGGSIIFDGTNDYISIPNSTALNPTNITVSAWINRTSTVNYAHFVGLPVSNTSWTSPYMSYGIEYIGTSDTISLVLGFSDNSFAYTNATAFGNNQWFQFIGTYDGNNVKVYINGAIQTTRAETKTMATSSANFYIGSNNASTVYPLNGKIGSVQLYNRALSASEVSNNYNSAKSRFSLT